MTATGSRAATEEEPTIVQDLPGFVLASYGNVLISVWGVAGTVVTAGYFAELSRAL